jgi:hypothetical protein
MMGRLLGICFLAVLASSAMGQSPPPPAQGVQFSGSVRLRYERWNWFEPAAPADNQYGFFAARSNLILGYQSRGWFDARVDLQNTTLLGLPENAAAPPPAGDLGLGPTYRASHGETNDTRFFLNQAYVTIKSPGRPGTFARLGRFEYLDGLETLTGDATIDWLKRVRLSVRLIGTFAFSHAGRSFDGGLAAWNRPSWNLTVLAAHPRQGGFEIEGMKEISAVDLAALTLTLKPGVVLPRSDLRLFYYYYGDDRSPSDTVVKVDNRPGPVRSADSAAIQIHQLGGHFAKAAAVGGGDGDLMLWGVYQTGDWGFLKHRAWALAAEIGYQPRMAWRPWIRAGVNAGSGDDNPSDVRHATFFQTLPTGRQYAQFPFFNAMNTQDLFIQLLLRPVAGKLAVRTELHRLTLLEPADLWYGGSGAFRRTGNFGFGGRPSNGNDDLATLLDLAISWDPSPQVGVYLYAGHAFGGQLVKAIYPDESADFGYTEVTVRF